MSVLFGDSDQWEASCRPEDNDNAFRQPPELGNLSQALAKANLDKLMMSETLQMKKLGLKVGPLPPHTILMLLVEPLACCTVIILFQILKRGFGCDMILKRRHLRRRRWSTCCFGAVSGAQSSVRWRCDSTFGAECCFVLAKSPGCTFQIRGTRM